MALSEPIAFGSYTLRCLLGAGAMARVYRAEHAGALGFQKTVALKMLDPRMSRNRRFIGALINEARIGGQLRSPHVVEVYEFNHVDGNYYLAMEYVDGWTLEDVLHAAEEEERPLPPRVLCRWAADIARGVHAAHILTNEEGTLLDLVHRDLKPGNVMIGRDGSAKVMDFGIAKARSNVHRTSISEGPKGTPVFMSPEQITEAGQVDARSDLFSLGSLFCEMAVFQAPFDAENPLVVMRKVLHDDPTPTVEQTDARVPGMGELIARCLERNPDLRWQAGDELADAIDALFPQMPEGAGPAQYLDTIESLPGRIKDGDFGPGSFVPEVSPAEHNSPEPSPTADAPAEEPPVEEPTGRRRPLLWPLLLILLPAAAYLTRSIFVSSSDPSPAPVITAAPTPKPTPAPTPKAAPPSTAKAIPAETRAPPTPKHQNTPRPTPPPTPQPEQGDGFLTLNAKPWGTVAIDGIPVGETPIRRQKLAAGPHTVRVHCSDGEELIDLTIEREYRIRVGQELRETLPCTP